MALTRPKVCRWCDNTRIVQVCHIPGHEDHCPECWYPEPCPLCLDYDRREAWPPLTAEEALLAAEKQAERKARPRRLR